MKNMENNYNDFSLMTPELMEKIAKEYALAIQKKSTSLNYYVQICNLLKTNLFLLENTKSNYTNLQKIYIKTNHLKCCIQSNIPKQSPIYNKSTINLKQSGVVNLCQIVKMLCLSPSEQNVKYIQMAIDIIENYLE